jgi:hypothetical protein
MLYYPDGTRAVKQRKYVRELKLTLDRPVCSCSLVTVLPTISWFLMYQTFSTFLQDIYFQNQNYIFLCLFNNDL